MAVLRRNAVAVVAVAAAAASGWVYPYVRPRPTESAPPAAVADPPSTPTTDPRLQRVPERVWHGRVTRVRAVYNSEDKQWLVEYPVWNVTQKREYVDGVWFSLPAGAVTDRRTGQPGELAVGQRVTVGYSGWMALSDPPQCVADWAVIEPEQPLPAQP